MSAGMPRPNAWSAACSIIEGCLLMAWLRVKYAIPRSDEHYLRNTDIAVRVIQEWWAKNYAAAVKGGSVTRMQDLSRIADAYPWLRTSLADEGDGE